jgi:hypothetical protein
MTGVTTEPKTPPNRKPGGGQKTRKPAGSQRSGAAARGPAAPGTQDGTGAGTEDGTSAGSAKPQTASKRRAAAEAAARKARAEAQRRARRRRTMVRSWVAIGVVVAAIALLVVVKLTSRPAASGGTGITAADPAVVSQVAGVPVSVLDSVGDGGVPMPFRSVSGNPPALTQGGLPRVLYVGGLFCPYCATERWPMVVALSRFGSFSGLRFVTSATQGESIQDIRTFDLSGSTYTSPYLAFTPFETQDRNHNPLQSLTAADSQLVSTYDAPPTLPSGTTPGTIPFLDAGNKWVLSGASYDAGLLEGKTWSQIASAAASGTGLGRQLDGTANWMTAALCSLTNGKPGNVCSDPVIAKLQARLPVR